MFETGKVYKVKVEPVPGQSGFGRATVIERKGNQLTITIRTSKGSNASFSKGTKVWFISESSQSFGGLWSSCVIDVQSVSGQSAMVCSPPKLEPLHQRRRTPRVALDVPVQVSLSDAQTLFDVRSRDISRSGIALESASPWSQDVEAGDVIQLLVHSAVGDIATGARIIRIQTNWLANKTVVGLEFTDLPEASVATLDKLLVQLGGKPRNLDIAQDKAKPGTGLSSWIASGVDVRGRFVGGSEFVSSGQTQEELETNSQPEALSALPEDRENEES